MAKVIISGIVLVWLLLGCNRDSERKEHAIEAVRNLREEFNRGDCQFFVHKTSLQTSDLQQEWLSGCKRMQETLGRWESFSHVDAELLPPSQNASPIRVEGRAIFANGGHLETYWLEAYWTGTGNTLSL